METEIDRMWEKATVLAGTGGVKSVSDLQAKLQADFPNCHFEIFDEKYSRKLTYVQELIHRSNRKR